MSDTPGQPAPEAQTALKAPEAPTAPEAPEAPEAQKAPPGRRAPSTPIRPTSASARIRRRTSLRESTPRWLVVSMRPRSAGAGLDGHLGDILQQFVGDDDRVGITLCDIERQRALNGLPGGELG